MSELQPCLGNWYLVFRDAGNNVSECSFLKISWGSLPPDPSSSSRFKCSKGTLQRQKCHVQCFYEHVRYFTKLLKSLHIMSTPSFTFSFFTWNYASLLKTILERPASQNQNQFAHVAINMFSHAYSLGTFRLDYEYEIDYKYDFRISSQWRFQSSRSSCWILVEKVSSWDVLGMWFDDVKRIKKSFSYSISYSYSNQKFPITVYNKTKKWWPMIGEIASIF